MRKRMPWCLGRAADDGRSSDFSVMQYGPLSACRDGEAEDRKVEDRPSLKRACTPPKTPSRLDWVESRANFFPLLGSNLVRKKIGEKVIQTDCPVSQREK